MFRSIRNRKRLQEEIQIVSESKHFDRNWYLDTNPDVMMANKDPAEHYLRHGWREGRNPSVKFNTKQFLENHPECQICPLVFEYNASTTKPQKTHQTTKQVKDSSYFDEAWYLEHYPEVEKSELSPYKHYMTIGWKKGYNPGPYFDTLFYLAKYPDIAKAGLNPFDHFVKHGEKEGRKPMLPNPKDYPQIYKKLLDRYFDERWYLKKYPEAQKSDLDAIDHYNNIGWREGYNPSRNFDTKFYLKQCPYLAQTGMSPLSHFLKYGYRTRCMPTNLNYDYYKRFPQDDYRTALEEWYRYTTTKELDLDNPKTFNEKVQWLKLYDSTPIKTRLADKYLVRAWVKEKIGGKYLIPLLGVYDSFDEIDFDELPKQFVIKCNHGSAFNIVVKDKSKLNLKEAKAKIENWLKINYAYMALELHYRDVPPKIIIEKYVSNNGKALYDYKFWCFNGEVKYMQFRDDFSENLKMVFYDLDWNKQPFYYDHPLYDKPLERPDNYQEMIDIAKKLCKGFPFVCVDLYRLNNGTIKFGEMTFTRSAGTGQWNDEKYNQMLGKMIELPKLAYNMNNGMYFELPHPCGTAKRDNIPDDIVKYPFYNNKIWNNENYFDAEYYSAHHPDVKGGICLRQHYEEIGWKKWCNASPNFNTKQYMKAHPECKICPLEFEQNQNGFVELSVAAIMRNEGSYLKEWIDYHRLVGVKRFYIYDNESTDNTKEVLRPYIEEGIIVYTYWPGRFTEDNLQSKSYKDCVDNYKLNTQWLAIIDPDEFIIPLKNKTVLDFLKDYEQYPGVVMNWIVYDSNGHVKRPRGGVLENYARVHYSHNCHDDIMIKSIVNPRKVAYPEGHCCIYNNGEYSVTENFDQQAHANNTLFNSTKKIRVNHYWTKSKTEYLSKIKKPRTDGITLKETEEHYNFPDYKYDYVAWKYAARLNGHYLREFLRYCYYQIKNSWIIFRHPKCIDSNEFFDMDYYTEHYPDWKKAGAVSAFEHYMTIGWKKGYNPSPKFDTSFYLTRYPDIAKAGLNPLVHYLEHGQYEGRLPCNIQSSVGNGSRVVQKTMPEYQLLKKSKFFDTAYYLKHYPEVKQSGQDPIIHYLTVGYKEGKNPSKYFDTSYYLITYPDIVAANLNPLVHYLQHGRDEGREISEASEESRRALNKLSVIKESEYWDEKYYLEQYGSDLGGKDPFVHYMIEGWKKGYNPSPLFDNDAYLCAYIDVLKSHVNPLLHYIQIGQKEGRKVTAVEDNEGEITKDLVNKLKKEKKRVLLISHEFSLTGAPRVLLTLAISLKRLGFFPVVISQLNGPLVEEIQKEQVECVVEKHLYLKLKRHDELCSEFLALFDTVLFNTILSLYLFDYFQELPVRKIAWIHEGKAVYDDVVNKMPLEHIFNCLDKVYSVGVYSQSFTNLYLPDLNKSEILFYGLPDIKHVTPPKIKKGKIKFVVAGAISERKGHDILLRAMDYLPKKIHSEVSICVVGPSLDEKLKQKLIKKSQTRKNLKYLGALSHDALMEQYKDADVILCPSRDDPMPLVCTEAFIFGKVVVVSENTGTAALIKDGEDGFIVPSGDAKALANAICRVVKCRDQLPEIGQKSRQIYENYFTLERFDTNVKRIFNETQRLEPIPSVSSDLVAVRRYDKRSPEYRLLKKSRFFNKSYYLKHYPEVKQSGQDPIIHYLTVGYKEGKNPSKYFDTNFYLRMHKDISMAGINPLVHYVEHGKKEGREIAEPYEPKIKSSSGNNIQNPFISIIVASYNYEDYIKKTLDSLLAQTYKNFEVIVVDDGSKDNSVKVVQKYVKKNSNIVLHRHHQGANKGLVKTIQLGLSKAKGDYIAFCESDDYWVPEHLQEKVNMIRKYGSPEIIVNDVELFDHPTREYEEYLNNGMRRFVTGRINVNILSYRHNPLATFSAVMFRTDVLRSCNFDSVIPAWTDWWLYRQILTKYPLYYINKPLTMWRIHDSYNTTARSDKYAKRLDEFILCSDAFLAKTNKKIRKKMYHGRDYKTVSKSKLFNEKWYLQQHPEVKEMNIPAVYHFNMVGWQKGYDPSPNFNVNAYINFYSDVKEAQINPLVHYIRSGASEHRIIIGEESKAKFYPAKKEMVDKYQHNILLVTHELSRTGAPILLLFVARLLKSKNNKITILSPLDGELRSEIMEENIDLIIDPRAFIDHDYCCATYFKYQFDFCICNTYINADIYSYLSENIPSILWIHDNLDDKGANLIMRVLSTSKDIYVPSERTKSCIDKYNQNIKMLSYPIKDIASEFKKKEHGKIKIGVCATIVPRKGQDIFIAAIRALSKKIRSDAEFLILGKNSHPKYMKSLKKSAKGISEIKFIPEKNNFKEYHEFLNDLDILVCPSREDPYPLVVIDAFMHSIPVVISDHVGQKQLITDKKNGYIFESENVAELTAILEEVIKGKMPKSMQKESRQLFEKNFSEEEFLKNLEKIMENTKCKK